MQVMPCCVDWHHGGNAIEFAAITLGEDSFAANGVVLQRGMVLEDKALLELHIPMPSRRPACTSAWLAWHQLTCLYPSGVGTTHATTLQYTVESALLMPPLCNTLWSRHYSCHHSAIHCLSDGHRAPTLFR